MDTSPVIEKIRKLLSLANSSNEHEAALAAAHAQRLLSEHNLAMADIDAAQKPERAERIELQAAKTLPKWLRHLSAGVCSAFDCQAIHHPATAKLSFIGVGADAPVAAYTFSYLERTVRKLCGSYMKQQTVSSASARQRELHRQSYYLGAVSTITTRLTEQKKSTPVTSTALVPVKDALIRRTMDEIGPIRTVHSRRSYINADAYATGQNDGRQVGIHRGIEQGQARQKALPPERR